MAASSCLTCAVDGPAVASATGLSVFGVFSCFSAVFVGGMGNLLFLCVRYIVRAVRKSRERRVESREKSAADFPVGSRLSALDTRLLFRYGSRAFPEGCPSG